MEHSRGTLQLKISRLEQEEIMAALRQSGWVMARAARKLGITERMIGYKVKKYGLRVKEVRWVEETAGMSQGSGGAKVRMQDGTGSEEK